jgi:hypothetical protein
LAFSTLPKFIQCGGNSGLNFLRAVTTQTPVHFFQAPDEVENFLARIRTAGSFAKVRATAEWPVGVNKTATRFAFKKRARAVNRLNHFLSTSGTKPFGGDESLTFGELRRQAGESEPAALGARLAGTFQWPLRQFRIHRPDFRQGML